MASMNERLMELDQKRQRLAEMRARKNQANATAGNAVPTINGVDVPPRPTFSTADVESLLSACGLSTQPVVPKSEANATTATQHNGHPSSVNNAADVPSDLDAPAATTSSRLSFHRVQPLEVTAVQQIDVAAKKHVAYSKTTQTEEDKYMLGDEFSMGSQEMMFDDELGGHAAQQHRPLSMDLDDYDDMAAHLLHRNRVNTDEGAPGQRTEPGGGQAGGARAEDQLPPRAPPLTEKEKDQILKSDDFQSFLRRAFPIVERALHEPDVTIDYRAPVRAPLEEQHDRLVLARTFEFKGLTDSRWVLSMDVSDQFGELLAVAYSERQHQAGDSSALGVVAVWNLKFNKPSPEFVFIAPSRVKSVCWARFHPHLLIGGCYTGQLVLWDTRVANKRTPVTTSPVTGHAHTFPVYALRVIGTHNSHQLLSVSSNGKICMWHIENLSRPLAVYELQRKNVSVLKSRGNLMAVRAVDQPANDADRLVLAGDDGIIYYVSFARGAESAQVVAAAAGGTSLEVGPLVADAEFCTDKRRAHHGSIFSVSMHSAAATNAPDTVELPTFDFGRLFLTASMDYTIKLWLTDNPKRELYTLRAHIDAVLDVAWSPTHPAVFASMSADELFLWNLIEDGDEPVAKYALPPAEDARIALYSNLRWMPTGDRLLVGDSAGRLLVYDAHDAIKQPRPDDWARFARVIEELIELMAEDEEASSGENATGGAVAVNGLPGAGGGGGVAGGGGIGDTAASTLASAVSGASLGRSSLTALTRLNAAGAGGGATSN